MYAEEEIEGLKNQDLEEPASKLNIINLARELLLIDWGVVGKKPLQEFDMGLYFRAAEKFVQARKEYLNK